MEHEFDRGLVIALDRIRVGQRAKILLLLLLLLTPSIPQNLTSANTHTKILVV